MEERRQFEEFSLLGGPLHSLGCRVGLVRGGTNTIALGLVLGLFLWTILVVLAFFGGVSHPLFSLSLIGAHIRLLLVIPLFFLCESWVDPRMTAFVRTVVLSGVVSENALPALESEIARIGRWKDSWYPEVGFLLVAVVVSLLAPRLPLSGTTAAHDPSYAMSTLSLAAQWYWIVCLTLFRFLLLRWLWRLSLWTHFLWRMSTLELNLVPTHPDGVAGLGYLEVVQIHFMPLVMAISMVLSASFAEDMSTGATVFEAIYPELPFILIMDAVLFLGPMCFFARKLWASKVKGLSDYMEFASSYVNGFDRKWLNADIAPEEPLLGTSDLQSLADLGNSIAVVREMRMVPVSPSLLTSLAIAALLPILPLFLLKYPATELAAKIFTKLFGL